MAEYAGEPVPFYRPPPEVVRYINPMELIETERIIRLIELKLGAYVETADRDGKKTWKRTEAMRPFFSDDFIHQIITHLQTLSNQVTSQVDYKHDAIQLRIRHYHAAFITMLACNGHDYFISQRTWERIKDIHQEKEVREFLDVDGKKTKKIVSGWYKYIGMDWTGDSPISRIMLKHVLDPNEDADQAIHFEMMDNQIFHFSESSLKRSEDAITVKHHISQRQTVRQEFSQDQPKQSGFTGRLNNIQSGGQQ